MVEKHGQEPNQKILRTVQNRSGSVHLDWDFALRLRPSPLRVASQLRLTEDSWCNAAEDPPKRRYIMLTWDELIQGFILPKKTNR